MQGEKRLAEMNFRNLDKRKLGLIVLLVTVLLGAGAYQSLSGKVRQAAEQNLLAMANEQVNGKIDVESIELSMLGAVTAKKVRLVDKAGQTVAVCERIKISYRWRDLFKGRLGLQLITGMTIYKPEVWLVYREGKFNIADLLKTREEAKVNFRGLVKVRNGTMNFAMTPLKNKIEGINGTLDFAHEDLVSAAFSGKLETSSINLDGQWTAGGSSAFALTAKGIELAKLGLTTEDDPLRITAGILDELTVKAEGTAGKIVLQSVEGRFSGVNTTGVLEVTQAGAGFTQQDTAISFTNISALYKGQPLTGSGRVLSDAEGNQTLDFAVELPSADPAAIMPQLKSAGTLAVNAAITGPARLPKISGSFTLGGLEVGGMAVSGISGSFDYVQNVMALRTFSGSTNGGSVSANGVIYPEAGKYSLSIAGSGLNSAQMTTKDVSGPLSFVGTAVGDADAALAQGSFTITDGKAYGLSFRLLTGDFVKRGSAEAEISNLALTTALGTFYPEQLNQDILNRLNATAAEKGIPTSMDALKKAGTEKLLQRILR